MTPKNGDNFTNVLTAGLTLEAVTDLHAAGLSVTAWPVPDPQTLAEAAALNVDGITADNPHVLPTG
jgi:glycerophosphoryl diester phosphodiesterase